MPKRKHIDNPTPSVLTLTSYNHISWVYALRFLRASHSLESRLPSDKWKENFESITNTAQRYNDRGIWLASHLMEALAHLRFNGSESMEDAQSAIAAAWSYQTDVGSQIPQLTALAHIIDVSCSIRQGNPKVMMTKLKEMTKMMDSILNDEEAWSVESERVAIPIHDAKQNSETVSNDTRAVLGIGRDGRDNLILSFLNKRDAYAIT